MPKNAGLSNAKNAKKDEFYTTYEDIQKELNYYEDKFRGQTVLCNCDDPYESNFCKFFLRNFNYLGLKRLICTSYSSSPILGEGQLTLFDDLDEPIAKENAYVFDISEVPMANGRGVSDDDIDQLLTSDKRGVKKLKGNGDFRSAECIDYLKQADIIVTNPPFSLFREYVSQLMEYNKKFLIIGNVNAITYKEIFPLIKDNLLWLGASIHSGDRKFYVPEDYPLNASTCGVDDDGRRYIRVKGVRWYTNIDYPQRHVELDLYKRYYGHEDEYPKFDNYDAINVDKTSDIPCDYFENMGVPITYIDKHNPEQFEIIGSSREMGRPMSEIAPEGSFEKGGPRFYISLDKIRNSNTILDRQTDRQTDRSCTNACTTELSSGGRCNGVMGVPITFLDKYNPDQFRILGTTESEGRGFSAGLWNEASGVAQPLVDGERRYKRLFIVRKV